MERKVCMYELGRQGKAEIKVRILNLKNQTWQTSCYSEYGGNTKETAKRAEMAALGRTQAEVTAFHNKSWKTGFFHNKNYTHAWI